MKSNCYTFIISAFTIFVISCTMQIKANKPIMSSISLANIEMLTTNENPNCGDCNVAGGSGANSCSCTGGTVSVDTPIGGIGGGGAACDVSVNPGYYACCYKDAKGFCRCPSCKEPANNH